MQLRVGARPAPARVGAGTPSGAHAAAKGPWPAGPGGQRPTDQGFAPATSYRSGTPGSLVATSIGQGSFPDRPALNLFGAQALRGASSSFTSSCCHIDLTKPWSRSRAQRGSNKMRRSPRSLLAWSRRAVGCRHHHRRRLQRSGNPAPPCTRSRCAASGARRGARSPTRCHARRERRAARSRATRPRPPRTPWSTSTTPSVAWSRSRCSRAACVLEPHLTERDRDGLSGLVPVGYRAVRVRPEDGLRPPVGAVVDVLVALDPTLSDRTRGARSSRARPACSRSKPTTMRSPTERALPSSSPRTRRAGSRLQRRTAS